MSAVGHRRCALRSLALAVLAVVAIAAVGSGIALAENRSALVIGIDDYANVPKLGKAVNDAQAVGDTLEAIGFRVVRGTDLRRREFNETLQSFLSTIEVGDIALFFYAGHGVRIEGRNYLLPRDIPDAKPGQETFVTAEAIGADVILDSIQRRGARVVVLILDACRDNPFEREGTRSVGEARGLARMSTPEGSFIMYSAAAGQTALDSLGAGDRNANSVFTRSLLPLISQPGMPLSEVAKRVRRDVQKLGKTVSHDQRPAYYDEITTEFALVPGTGGGSMPGGGIGSMGGMGPPDDRMIELTFWNSIANSRNAASYEEYLRRYPKGEFANLARLKIDELKAPPSRPEPQPQPQPSGGMDGMAAQKKAVELAYWTSISQSRDAALFRSYLERYPNGDFAELARLKIEQLAAAPVIEQRPVQPPPSPQPVYVTPSFNCAKASKADEYAICGSSRLAQLDQEMAAVYAEKRNSGSQSFRTGVRNSQRAWLKQRANCGANVGCIEQRYLEQLDYLRSLY